MSAKRKPEDIRPLNGGAAAPVKRQRVSKACDQCRAAREKCDGVQPACFPCVSQSRPCTYDANPKKRGVQTGYIRTLERTLAWVFKKVPGSEEALDTLLAHEGKQSQDLLSRKETRAGSELHKVWRRSKACQAIEQILSGSDGPPHLEMSDKPSPSEQVDSESDEDRTSLVQPSETGQSQSLRRFVMDGRESADPSLRNLLLEATPVIRRGHVDLAAQLYQAINPRTFCGKYVLSKDANEQYTPSAYVLHILFLWAGTMLDASAEWSPSPVLDSIEQYLEQFGSCSAPPFLASCMFMMRHRRAFNDLSPHDQRRWDSIAALLARTWSPSPAGMNIGRGLSDKISLSKIRLPSNHWRLLDIYWGYTHSWFPVLEKQEILKTVHLYHDLEQSLSPNDPATAPHAELWGALALASFQDAASPLPGSPESNRRQLAPQEIYDVARMLIPSEDGPFQIHHVRALLFLALINLGKENFTAAWILMGFASRIALNIGLKKPRQHQQDAYPARTPSVMIGFYVLDIITCMRCNENPTWGPEDIEKQPRLSEDGLDEWEKWTPCDGFGVTSAMPHLSRTPAYSLSTLNQISDIFQVVGRYLATTKEQSMAPPAPAQTLRPPNVSSQVALTPASVEPTFAPSVPTPSSFYSSSTAPLPAPLHSETHHYRMSDAPYMLGTYQHPTRPLLSPANTRATYSLGTSPHASNVLDVLDSSTQPQIQHQLQSRSNFNDMLDYDALLEDLSAIDCADRVDTDPQFMMNLGFAPGCDIAEILTRDFGAA